MAQEIGAAYVTLLPSAKGFGKAVEREMSGAYGSAEKEGKGFFGRLGTLAKGFGLAVAGAVGVLGALTVKGGISRALNIEDAQAKLKGLGHDTKAIESIMTDALASVKGTAFGLDTAATVAATAVAAGIKPGQELEKYLRLTADAATIAGVSMQEMGSILNKATTAGKVYTQELNQLADRGLPIFQWLQEEYGVTAEELRKMVAAGKVDAETFRKVIEENIGGAALASGETTRGAFANMRAAINRLGATLTGPILGQAKTFFGEMIIVFDGLETRVRPAVERFANWMNQEFTLDGFGEKTLGVIDRVIKFFTEGFGRDVIVALTPLLPILGTLATLIGGALGDALIEVAEALAPVLPMLAEELVNAVQELTPSFVELVRAIVPLLPELVELAVEILPGLVSIARELVPLLVDLIQRATEFLRVTNLLIDLLGGDVTLDEYREGFLSLTGPMSDAARGVSTFMESVRRMAETVRKRVDEVVNFFTTLPDRIRKAIPRAGEWLLDTGRDIIRGLIRGVREKVEEVVSTVRGVAERVVNAAKTTLQIESPSRVFRDEVGAMIGAGLIEGLEASQAGVSASINHLVQVPESVGGVAAAAPSFVFEGDSAAFMRWMNVYEQAADGRRRLVIANGKKVA